VCSGGRYDDLASHYTDSKLPGVGVSIGLTRLYWQLRDLGLLDTTTSPVKVLVGLIDEQGSADALALAANLRAAAINTEATLEPGKLSRQLKYADRSGIRFLALAGPDERTRSVVMLRDLQAKSQDEIPADQLVDAVKRRLREKA
jgi:histidyl-tRNA synthetase